MDDRALADTVLNGDRDAFRLLVERESVVVYRACLRILGHSHDAEDVAQETFVIAYRSLGSYRGDGPLGGWLLRIATRQAFRRAKQRTSVALDDGAPIHETRPEVDPATVALRHENGASVRSAVARLADPYREVVALRFFGELSLNEIAVATRRPVPTIKTQLRRGLERLRSTIGPEAAL